MKRFVREIKQNKDRKVCVMGLLPKFCHSSVESECKPEKDVACTAKGHEFAQSGLSLCQGLVVDHKWEQ